MAGYVLQDGSVQIKGLVGRDSFWGRLWWLASVLPRYLFTGTMPTP